MAFCTSPTDLLKTVVLKTFQLSSVFTTLGTNRSTKLYTLCSEY